MIKFSQVFDRLIRAGGSIWIDILGAIHLKPKSDQNIVVEGNVIPSTTNLNLGTSGNKFGDVNANRIVAGEYIIRSGINGLEFIKQ